MLTGSLWVYQTADLELMWASLIPALFCFGAGAGMALARLTEITLSPVRTNELGEAVGGDSTGKELGAAFGVSVLVSINLWRLNEDAWQSKAEFLECVITQLNGKPVVGIIFCECVRICRQAQRQTPSAGQRAVADRNI
jgi:hypothetical protein